MQLIVEPDLGFCDNLKPNRFLGTERKRFLGPCIYKVLYIFTKEWILMDLLQKSASAWKEITEYRYSFVYGYKKKLYTINLTFALEEFPHLAGFQYMKDISVPNYSSSKIVDRILEGKISFEKIQNAAKYKKMIEPRLEALVHLKDSLDNEFKLYSYMPSMYPFYTEIKADYLISSHLNIDSFVFIIQVNPEGDSKCDFLCCSIFEKGERDYEVNQRSRTLMKKERIHIPTNTSIILLDRLLSQNQSEKMAIAKEMELKIH